jgi:hypothetical protein
MALLRNFESLVQVTALDDGKEAGKEPAPHPLILCGETVKTKLIFKESMVHRNDRNTVSQVLGCFRAVLAHLAPL